MKIQKLIVLILILGALISAAVVKSFREKAQRVEYRAESGERIVFNEGLELSSVNKITVTRGLDESSRVILSKTENGDWVMTSLFGIPARKSMPEELIKKLTQLKGELRSDAEGVLTDFKIDDSQGLHVVLEGTDSKVLSHTILSLTRPGPSGNFVRLANASTVIVSKEDLLAQLGFYSPDSKLEQRNFADFKVVTFDPSKMSRVQITPKDTKLKPIVLVRSGSDPDFKWSFEPGSSDEIDLGKVNSFLSTAANLYAMNAFDPALTTHGFSEKPWIEISGTDNEKPIQLSFTLGNALPNEKAVLLKVLPSGHVFSVHENNLETLLKQDKASFIKPKTSDVKK